MSTESYPTLLPLLIIIPAVGAFINLVWGAKLTERISGLIGIIAALLTFGISLLLFIHLTGTHSAASVVDPSFFSTWIKIDGPFKVDIPWQFRLDGLNGVMLLVVTGVGSLIHIYSMGYIHADKKFSRFFAYLNMFMMFMLLLVTSNNFLMLFVGWEGVGLMSYLLIGFWWDKGGALGWKNANAARKAMIVNRIGDFGVLLAIFLIFWTFGTLSFYQPGETANVCYAREVNNLGECEPEAVEGETVAATESETTEGNVVAENAEATGETAAETTGESASEHEQAGGDGTEAEHEVHAPLTLADVDNSQFVSYKDLGAYGQAQYLMSLPENDPARMISFGPNLKLDIKAVLFLIVIFMLLGVSGKSAQIPLFVWLPDAMAGPTPVSALIHAATMVTAGVFLLIRSNVFLDFVPEARLIITIIGTATAVMAGFVAMGQWDIKRVLAYSTVSQLGFMVAAVGLGAYVAALFHLATHAVFKALLFLGSGSIIHGVEHGHHIAHGHGDHGHDDEHGHGHDEHHDPNPQEEAPFDPQDMRNMGGLWERMPITFITYMFGTFALMGLPFFAGFWSKDEILADAWEKAFGKHPLLVNASGLVALVLFLAAGLTAFYMWRQIQMVFFGKPRSEAADKAPESSAWMTLPLIILALLSFWVGWLNVPEGFFMYNQFLGARTGLLHHFVEAAIPSLTGEPALQFNWLVALGAVALAALAIIVAHGYYAGDKAVAENNRDPLHKQRSTRQMWSLANARMYWDEIYFRLFENPYNRISKFLADVVDWRFLHDYFHDTVIKSGYDGIARLLANPFDLGIIDGVVNGVGRVVGFFSRRVRTVQTGYVRVYALILLLGVVAVLLVMVLPLLQVSAGS